MTDTPVHNRCKCEKEAKSVCLACANTSHSYFPECVAWQVPRGCREQVTEKEDFIFKEKRSFLGVGKNGRFGGLQGCSQDYNLQTYLWLALHLY